MKTKNDAKELYLLNSTDEKKLFHSKLYFFFSYFIKKTPFFSLFVLKHMSSTPAYDSTLKKASK